MAKLYNITAKAGKDANAASTTINLNGPETLKEAEEMYGADAVLTNSMANFVVTMQGRIRADIKAGMTPEAIQEKHANDKMGVSLPKGQVDPVAAIKSKWSSMSKEERNALLVQLKASA